MWELIEANKRKSIALIAGLFLLLVVIGGVFGAVFAYQTGDAFGTASPEAVWQAAFTGSGIGTALAFLLFLIAWFGGDGILLDSLGAKEITHEIHPMLFNVVEEMRIAANMPHRPRIYILDAPWPNAFATGIRKDKTAVAVTSGLLVQLNRDELQGVIAHEMSHILHRDVLFMTLAATMLGSIQILTDGFLRSMRFSGTRRSRYRSGSSKSSGGSAAVVVLIALVISIFGMLLARIFYFAISRKREYLADANGARLTRYPEGLASALEKIASYKIRPQGLNQFASASFTANPLDARAANSEGSWADLTSTHPPIQKRVRILRSMMSGASFQDYARAFASIQNKSDLFPASALKDSTAVPIRKAVEDRPKAEAPKEIERDMGNLIAAANGFAFFKCMCGLRFKIPPNYKEKKIPCPRCGMVNEIPFLGAIGTTQKSVPTAQGDRLLQPVPSQKTEQVYERKSTSWESFFCQCGRLIQLAPSFNIHHLNCPKCKKSIRIIQPGQADEVRG